MNTILPRMSDSDIKQKIAWNICFIIYPNHQNKKCINDSKAKNIPVKTTIVVFLIFRII